MQKSLNKLGVWLVCFLLHLSSFFSKRPDVIRLAALRCSDFPLLIQK